MFLIVSDKSILIVLYITSRSKSQSLTNSLQYITIAPTVRTYSPLKKGVGQVNIGLQVFVRHILTDYKMEQCEKGPDLHPIWSFLGPITNSALP